MPTTDRTTIQATVSELVTKLRTNLVADPPTAAAPFRRVIVGAADGAAYARPFLSLELERARPVGVTDDDRLFEVSFTMTVFVDATDADAHAVLLDAVGAVEDYFDAIVDTGVIEGAAGFDDRTWTFHYPKTTSGARPAAASATGTFIVNVERTWNRTPAP